MPLLEAVDLKKTFAGRKRLIGRRSPPVAAVDGVSFQLRENETVAVIGESGAGKSTVARMVARLVEADSGRVTFDGRDLLSLQGDELRRARSDLTMIFQDP